MMPVVIDTPCEATAPNAIRAQLAHGRLKARLRLDVANLKEATEVIVRHHYLHRGRTMGQMPYWIVLDGERVGVLLYAYPRMSAIFHGYRPMNLLELARMWIDPAVQGLDVIDSDGRKHTLVVATCAVGRSLRRIRQDWHGKYPHLPGALPAYPAYVVTG